MNPTYSRWSPQVRPAPETARRAAWLAAVETAMVAFRPTWSWRFDRDLALDLMRKGYAVEQAAEWLVGTSS